MKLIDKVNGFDLTAFKGSDTVITDRHHVVGELSDYLQRLFGLLRASTTRVEELVVTHNVAVKELELEAARKGRQPSQEDATQLAAITELRGSYERAQVEVENLRNAFWASVRVEFPELLEKESIHVVDGFKVAWSEVDRSDSMTFESILESILARR
jgi:hypothetical protein